MDLMKKVDNYKTRGNHRICEVHFEEKYVRRSKSCDGRKFLTKDAFPTLCLQNPTLIVPMTSENLVKPPVYTQNIIWRQYHAATQDYVDAEQNSLTINHEPEISPRGRAMILRNNRHYNQINEPLDDVDDEVTSPPSSPPYEDISQFCESVMKVSKGTQTWVTGNDSRKLDAHPQVKNNKTSSKEAPDIDKQSFLQTCSKFLPPSLSKIVNWNLSSANGRQNINFILFAINIYYSCNLYNLLRDMLSLPTKDTLKYFLLPKSTRLNENFINAFRCKVNNMSTKERICSFSVGSILLKPNLYYDIKHDRVIGLHDVNGEQNICIAKYAILLMVEGILENWRQPIAYAFISEYDYFPEISTWIDEVLATLIDIGLDVRVFVSDPRSEFLYASELRYVTPEKTCFTVNGTDIYYTYDTTQLLKVVKNNLKSCDFEYGPNSKIRNNNDFFRKLNDLCHVLNAKSYSANSPYKRAFSNKKYENNFLTEMLQLFSNLKVVRKVDGADVTENMKFVEGFQITINSVLQLFEELNFLGVKRLLTSRLNHNSLNRFLTKIKPLNSKEECTPRRFNKAFVRSFVFNVLKKPIGDTNIENSLDSEDFSQQLLNEEFQKTQSNTCQPLSVYTTDYRWGLPEKNAFVYVCGYCYLKCVQRHSCETFKSYLNEHQTRQEKCGVYLCSVSLDLTVKNCQMMPPDDFTEFLMLLENKFKNYLKPGVLIANIGHEILEEFENYGFGMPCPCFPLDYLKALFVRVRLFYTIRKNNKLILRKKGVKRIKVFSL